MQRAERIVLVAGGTLLAAWYGGDARHRALEPILGVTMLLVRRRLDRHRAQPLGHGVSRARRARGRVDRTATRGPGAEAAATPAPSRRPLEHH